MSINNKKVSINTQIANTGKITAIVHKNPESNIQILSTIKSSGGSVDLNNYYTKEEVYNKEETYNKEEVNSLIDGTEKNIEDLEKDFQDSMDTLESSVSERYTGLEEKMYEINTQLHDTVFDTNGYYFTGKIRPLSIDTSLLTVGSLSQQFTLLDSSFFITKNSTTDNIIWTSGKLVHFAISREDKENTWIFTSGEFNFTSDESYYVYVKASKNNEEASILVSTVQYITEIDGEDFYYFLCGTVSSIMTPEDGDPFRHLSLSYGTTSINGRFIHTGCIKSNNGETYFDLDKGEIGGNIVFKSGENGEYQNLVDTLLGIDNSIGNIQRDIQDVNVAVGAVDSKSDNLAIYIDDAFKDGILDEAERKAIIEQKNGLVSQYNSLIKEHNAIDDYSEYDIVLWNNFIQSWSQLCAEYDELIETINAIINYNSSTQKLKTLIDNYNEAYIAFDLALNGDKDDESEELRHGYTDYLRSIKKLIDELVADEYADKKVSDIKVGGRNLLRNSKNGSELVYNSVNNTITKTENDEYTDITATGVGNSNKCSIDVPSISTIDYNKQYTLSFSIEAYSNISTSCLVNLSTTHGVNTSQNSGLIQVGGGWKRLVFTGYVFNNETLKIEIKDYYEGYTNSAVKFRIKNIKLEEGNVATAWTPAPEDVSAEISEVSTALENTNDVLSKSLEDGVIDNTEIVRIKDALKSLGKEYNDLVQQNKALNENPYLKGSAKDNLASYYDSLDAAYNSYKSALEKITSTAVINALKPTTTSRFKTIKINLTDFVPNWKYDTDYETHQTNFTSALKSYTYYVTKAQESINEEIKNSIQVGGVNLVSNIPSNWENKSWKETANAGTLWGNMIYNNTKMIRIKQVIPAIGTITISHNEGYKVAILQFDENKGYLGKKNGDTGWLSTTDKPLTQITIKLNDATRYIACGVTLLDNTSITNLPLNTIYDVKLQIEQGTKATAWKPNDADTIEARENILKDAMLLTLNNRALQIDLTKSTKLNTEYVFSLESSVLPTNTNSVKVRLYDDPQEADEWNDNYLFEFNITSGTKFAQTLIFNGSFSELFFNSSIDDVTLVGVKLAEGNIYTGWEGTPDEQQALITLNNAMKGSTDIIGGLVMTNLIGMKGHGTEANQIKAGISGLNENNNLRFWAGSTAWSDANTAPFRVYDDGRVFGKLFYASQQSLTLNSSHITKNANSEYFSYDSGVYRLNADNIPDTIYLDSTLANYSIGLPKKYSKDKTIEIYNPHKLALSFLDIVPNPVYCNISNFRNNSWHPKTNASNIMPILSTLSMQGNESGYMSYNIGVKDTSASNYKPTYIKLKNIKVTLYGQVQYITVNNTAAYYYVMYIPGWVYDNLLIKETPNGVSQTNVNLGTSTSNTHVRYTRLIGANLPTSNKSFSLDFKVWVVETISDDYLTDAVNY